MSTSIVLSVCALASLMIPAISAMNRHQQELKEHYEHLSRVAEFECSLPQPRLLPVHEILSELQTHGKAYFPEVTVLHRCDKHVGACSDASYHCGPAHTTNVSMLFKVTFLENMDGHVKGEWGMEYHHLENHTSCGCFKVEQNLPKIVLHYHFVDPSLIPPQGNYAPYQVPNGTLPLPLETSNQNVYGNVSSYEVPLYPFNNTPQQPPRNDSDLEQLTAYKPVENYSETSTQIIDKESNNPCSSCIEL